MDASPYPAALRYADPLWLAQSPLALPWIAEQIENSSLDNHVAELLDYAYRVRLALLLRTRAESEELLELSGNIRKVANPIRARSLNSLSKPYAARWQGFVAILEDRLSVMRQHPEIPDTVKERRHALEILKLIQHRGQVAQQELREVFALEEANLSRILTLLEGWELISRHRRGKEKLVTLGPRASEVLEADPLAPPSREEVARLNQRVAELEQEIARLNQENAQPRKDNQLPLELLRPATKDEAGAQFATAIIVDLSAGTSQRQKPKIATNKFQQLPGSELAPFSNQISHTGQATR